MKMKTKTTYTQTLRAWKLAAGLALCLTGPAASAATADRDDAEIRQDVATYIQSINQGDVALGGTVFHPSEETTFIHPRGTERGWLMIQRDIYAFFRDTFTKRELKRVGDLHLSRYGDSAVVEFEWDFVATFKGTNAPLHSTGRESQFLHKFPNEGWRIVHVHYSGMPVTAAGRGF